MPLEHCKMKFKHRFSSFHEAFKILVHHDIWSVSDQVVASVARKWYPKLLCFFQNPLESLGISSGDFYGSGNQNCTVGSLEVTFGSEIKWLISIQKQLLHWDLSYSVYLRRVLGYSYVFYDSTRWDLIRVPIYVQLSRYLGLLAGVWIAILKLCRWIYSFFVLNPFRIKVLPIFRRWYLQEANPVPDI